MTKHSTYIANAKEDLFISMISLRMADDINAGILLDRLRYWFTPNKDGRSKLRVRREGHYWVAKSRKAWTEECGLSERQVDSARQKLEELGLIEVKLFRFNGAPTLHYRLILEKCDERFVEVGGVIQEEAPEQASSKEEGVGGEVITFIPPISRGRDIDITKSGNGHHENGKTISQGGDGESPNGENLNRNYHALQQEGRQTNDIFPPRFYDVQVKPDIRRLWANKYHQYFAASRLLDRQGKTAIVELPSEAAREFLRGKRMNQFVRFVKLADPTIEDVRLVLPGEAWAEVGGA